ncbi:MAG: head decoration protein [Sulfuricellaceae bacterium]
MPSATLPLRLSDLLKYEISECLYSRDTITLAAGNKLGLGAVLGKISADDAYTEFDPTAGDGSQIAAAVLLKPTSTGTAAVKTVALKRHSVVSRQALVWKAGVTAPEKAAAEAALTALGIVVRDAL